MRRNPIATGFEASASARTGPHYREGGVNDCPCCGGHQWIVGRVTAECADCAMPLPLKATMGLAILSAIPAIMLRASRTA